MSEGIGDMQLTTVLMHKADGFLQFLFGEVGRQSGGRWYHLSARYRRHRRRFDGRLAAPEGYRLGRAAP